MSATEYKKDLLPLFEVNVKDFGAKGDNSQDDQPFIQEAIRYAMVKGSKSRMLYNPTSNKVEIEYGHGVKDVFRTIGGGCKVVFPSGTYLIDNPIVLPATGTDDDLRTKGFCIHLEGNPMTTIIRGGDGFPYSKGNTRGLIEWDPVYNWKSIDTPYVKEDMPKNVKNFPPNQWEIKKDDILLKLESLAGTADFEKEVQDTLDIFISYREWAEKELNVLHNAARNRALHQRISNLTLYCPEQKPAHAIYRRWPFPLFAPTLLVEVEKLLEGLNSPSTAKWLAEYFNWTKSFGFIQTSKESSRLNVHINEIIVYGNNGLHESLFRFEGSVYKSSIKNITGCTSLRKEVKFDRIDNSPVNHDTALLHFDEGKKTDYGSDSVGFQQGIIENIHSGPGGGMLCMFRGRISTSRWDGAFGNGAMHGPSYHFINSANAIFTNLHSEARNDKGVFLLEGCHALRFNTIGVGTPHPLGEAGIGWNNETKPDAFTMGPGIILKSSTDCIFDSRQGISPLNNMSYVMSKHVYNKEKEPTITDIKMRFRFTDPFCFISADDKSYRNQFKNFQVLMDMVPDTPNIASLNDVEKIELFLKTEFKLGSLGNLNSVSGWLNFSATIQPQLKETNMYKHGDDYFGSKTDAGLRFQIGELPEIWETIAILTH